MKALAVFLRGLAMGISDIIPGISGGTIALITGIYEKLITTFSVLISFFKEVFLWMFGSSSAKNLKHVYKQIDIKFLCALLSGLVLAIILGALVLTVIIERYEVYFLSVLLGLIITSAFFLFVQEVKKRQYSVLALGISIGAIIAFLSPLTVTQPALWYVVLGGFLAISAMLLPGISGSFILLLLGLYGFMLQAIRDVNVLIISLFILGIVAGVLVMIKGIHWLLEHKQQATLQLMLGFILGSSLVPLRQIQSIYAGESVVVMLVCLLLACAFTSLIFFKKSRS